MDRKRHGKGRGWGVVYYLTIAWVTISDKLRSAKSELVPEVGIPSVDSGQAHRHGAKPLLKILNDWGLRITGAGGRNPFTSSGQAHRHGVEAPRDFESNDHISG